MEPSSPNLSVLLNWNRNHIKIRFFCEIFAPFCSPQSLLLGDHFSVISIVLQSTNVNAELRKLNMKFRSYKTSSTWFVLDHIHWTVISTLLYVYTAHFAQGWLKELCLLQKALSGIASGRQRMRVLHTATSFSK